MAMDLRRQLEALTTEAINPDFARIDEMSLLELAELMNREDATVPLAVKEMLPSIASCVELIAERMEKGGRLVYAGAGTAGRMGVLDAVECTPTFNTPIGEVVGLIAGGEGAMMIAVEGAEDDPMSAHEDLRRMNLTARDVVVGISASGRTPYAVGAVQYGNIVGALTIGLSCNRNSEVCSAAQQKIEVVVGAELVAGSTRLKAGTAQKLVLNMLSTLTMIQLGKTYGNLMVNLRTTNRKLVARSFRIVKEATGASENEVNVTLEKFDGDVKSAIVSLLSGAPDGDVTNALKAAKGRVRAALDSLRGSATKCNNHC